MTLTIEALEALATELEADRDAKRARLLKLISLHARILAVKAPGLFRREATEYGDEAGHWDNSYPPEVEYRCFRGPSTITVVDHNYQKIATSSGFCYDWRAETSEPGLSVDKRGRIYSCEYSGTGRVGQYAAHPGNCDVSVSLEWSERAPESLSIEELTTVERVLRGHVAESAAVA